jgi:hypothetical protein
MKLKQARKLLSEETQEAMATETAEQLKARLALAAQHSQETTTAMEGDSGLETAKATAKELAAPYRETLKGLAALTRVALAELDQRKGAGE